MKKCIACQADFKPRRRDSVFCTRSACRSNRYREKYPGQYGRHELLIDKSGSPSTVGAIGELITCSDLLRRGFNVFRSVSPTAIADLVAIKGDRRIVVEVTVGRRNISGDLSYNRHSYSADKFDTIAVVEANGVVTYIPELAM